MAKELKVYVLYAFLLNDTENNGCLVWDNNRLIGPSSWPTNKDKAFKYETYLDVWNRLQLLYKEHKQSLNKLTFGIIETTIIKVDDIYIDPQIRINELHEHFFGGNPDKS